MYEGFWKQGSFANEPDFPVALEWYRQALEEAARGDPPFYPPADFEPNLSQRQRVEKWRWSRRYPQVQAAWSWLGTFLERWNTGIAPVTEAEFHELEDWFHANDRRLDQLSESSLLDLGNGKKACASSIRYGLGRGPRDSRVTELVEDLRKIKARYGDANAGAEQAIPGYSALAG